MTLLPDNSLRLQDFRHWLRGFLRLVLLVAMVTGGITGCGYTLVGGTDAVASRRIPLAVVPFLNHTSEPGLESHLTVALRQAIVQSPVFVLTAATTAPRRIEGTIRHFRFYPLSFDQNDNALQYRLEVDVVIRLTESDAQHPSLERQISTWAEYLVSNTGVVRENVVAKEAALVRLAQRFADTLTALLTVQLL
jgi:outer membrane lipopolysaccharide assembly protein LptE/RlpB